MGRVWLLTKTMRPNPFFPERMERADRTDGSSGGREFYAWTMACVPVEGEIPGVRPDGRRVPSPVHELV